MISKMFGKEKWPWGKKKEKPVEQVGFHLEKILEAPAQGLILSGGQFGSMEEQPYHFSFPLEAEGYLGCDMGMGKDPNEDAAVVVPEQNFLAAIDGVGGYMGGDKAAFFLAKGLLIHHADYEAALHFAKTEMERMEFEDTLRLYGSSACFVGGKIFTLKGTRFFTIGMCGDCRVMVFQKNGDILQTEDESYVMELVKGGSISSDEALYNDFRNRITNAVRMAFPTEITINPKLMKNGEFDAVACPLKVEKGDRILLSSDGISDNLTPEELFAISRDLPLKDAYIKICDTVRKRMQEMESQIEGLIRDYLQDKDNIAKPAMIDRLVEKIGAHEGPYTWLYQTMFHKARYASKKFPDGYISKPSRDNRTLAILEIH